MAKFCCSEEIRNAASVVVRQCNMKGENVSESLAVFMLRLLVLDPDWVQLFKENSSDQALMYLSEVCIQKLMERCNPSITALKIQVFFDLNYRNARQFLAEHKQMHSKSVQPILQRILSFLCNTGEDCEMLHNEIIAFVMVKENIDHRYDTRTFKEIKTAVSTLLPVCEVPTFVQLSRKEKKQYLSHLAPVAAGIRLYNWHEGSRKSTLTNVADVAVLSALKLSEDFKRHVGNLENQIIALQGILNYYYFYEGTNNEEVSHINFPYLKSYLTFIYQYKFYLDTMMNECNTLTPQILKLERSFKIIMKNLKMTLSSTSSTPSVLFSLYRDSCHVWKAMGKGLLFLNSLLNTFQVTKHFIKSCNVEKYEEESLLDFWNEIKSTQSLKKEVVSIDKINEAKQESNSEKSIISLNSGIENKQCINDPSPSLSDVASKGQKKNLKIISSYSVKNFYDIYLQFQGFCPWALVHGKGLLLKGIPDLGIVMYNDWCYAFSCIDGRNEFMKNADLYINSVIDIVRKEPQLVVLLNLQCKFHIDMCNQEIFEKPNVLPIFISDSSCQTVLHPVEKSLDYKYKWNEWELRKQALKYVDIRSKRTHSTQTFLSHFQRENFSQVYLPKDNWSQTKKDGNTSTTKSLGVPDLIIGKKIL